MELPSPRGVRIASGKKWMGETENAENVAVPARGADCICLSLILWGQVVMCCRPRKGCGLHLVVEGLSGLSHKLPSPQGVRIASYRLHLFCAHWKLPSPQGVRIASQAHELAVQQIRELPSPQGVRIASAKNKRNLLQDLGLLPSPQGVRIASAKGYKSV